jgi:hypothetical protein
MVKFLTGFEINRILFFKQNLKVFIWIIQDPFCN